MNYSVPAFTTLSLPVIMPNIGSCPADMHPVLWETFRQRLGIDIIGPIDIRAALTANAMRDMVQEEDANFFKLLQLLQCSP